jgi:hypothetical protein
MTNWWTLTAILTEVTGAALIARGLSLEGPIRWVKGRGTGRWTLEPDADLNYAASSTDAGVGFTVLVLGLALQAVSAINSAARGAPWLLAVPAIAGFLALAAAARWCRYREVSVIRIRIEGFVIQRVMQAADWQVIVHSYSRALAEVDRGPKSGEDAWAHLDRIYGENRWLPKNALERMRESYETNVSIVDRDELGNLWLPWFVHAENPAQAIQTLDRSQARQLRVRDVIDDPVFRPALELEYENGGRRWTHLGRIEEIKDQWSEQSSVGQGRFPAYRTADGPVLQDGCHRACALYALNPPDWHFDLGLLPSPDDHPDIDSRPRDVALGRMA